MSDAKGEMSLHSAHVQDCYFCHGNAQVLLALKTNSLFFPFIRILFEILTAKFQKDLPSIKMFLFPAKKRGLWRQIRSGLCQV